MKTKPGATVQHNVITLQILRNGGCILYNQCAVKYALWALEAVFCVVVVIGDCSICLSIRFSPLQAFHLQGNNMEIDYMNK